jgi:predicted alpha/beta hydrolase family esterase
MKRAIIVHGFKGKPDTNWKPWLKAELEANGFIVDVPGMPNTDAPQLEEWVATLRQIIGEFTSDDIYLIGHSLGCITILNYLQTLQETEVVTACIFVAGFTRPFKEYRGGHDSFFANEVNYPEVKKHSKNFIAIQSEDDTNVGIEELRLFKDKLGAQLIKLNGFGHFGSADGVFEVPEIEDVVLGIPYKVVNSKYEK